MSVKNVKMVEKTWRTHESEKTIDGVYENSETRRVKEGTNKALQATHAQRNELPCADPSNSSFGPLPETTSPFGYEPNNLIEDNSMVIKPMFFHKPSMTSACDTSDSTATPSPESDLVGERSKCRPSTSLSLFQRRRSVKFISLPRKYRETCRVVLTQKKVESNKPVQGKGETFFRFSDQEEAARLVLEQQRDHLLAEANSEILKQECKVDTIFRKIITENRVAEKMVPRIHQNRNIRNFMRDCFF